MALYAAPGQSDSLVSVQDRYGNFIGGEFVPPSKGRYFENPSPVNGKTFTEIARSTGEDIELALDAAHGAKRSWGRTSAAERSVILNKIADRIESNLEMLAVAETWENGKPIRESLAADLPLAVDHFRYFAGAIRAQEGSLSEIDADTIAYHFHEPLGVVAQIIPWNFPILMAVWKLARWPRATASSSSRVAKVAFTGETTTGRLIMQYASQNLIPVTLELGGKSPNIFFSDVAAARDDFYDKALEGFTMFALNGSPTKPTRSRSPTTPSTGSARASGPGTARVPTGRAGRSRRAGYGRTATTPTRRTPPSAVTSSPGSAARTTR
jgi:aldehyde dehydrogenase